MNSRFQQAAAKARGNRESRPQQLKPRKAMPRCFPHVRSSSAHPAEGMRLKAFAAPWDILSTRPAARRVIKPREREGTPRTNQRLPRAFNKTSDKMKLPRISSLFPELGDAP